MFLWTGHFVQRPDEPNYNHSKPVINRSKLTPLPSDKFKTAPALDKELTDAVSFQYPRKNGWYLTVKDYMCFIEPKRRTANFERSSSFFPLVNFWFDGYTVFESSVKAGWYLRLVRSKLTLDRYDGTDEFKKDSSFKVKRKKLSSSQLLQRPLTAQSSSYGCCSMCDSNSEVCSTSNQQVTASCCQECECFIKNDMTEDSVL